MSEPIVINIGALPNDGTGDPLRTAFNDVNLNFANVFASGPVGSNIQIANNIVSTLNTNGNLVLSPNGVGIVQANSHVVPNQTRLRNLGSANLLWNVTYTQYLNTTYATIGTANIGNIGTLTIDVGNLHLLGGTNGYVLQTDGTGNLTWTAQTGGSGNGVPGGANTQVQYNNAGAFGGTAGFTFDNTSNTLSAVKINTTDVFNSNGIVLENSDLTQGATAAVVIPTNGSSDPIQVNNTYGNIALQTGAGSGITASWSFDNTGNLTFPDNSGSSWPVNAQRFGMGNIGAWLDGQWTIGEFSGNGVSGTVGIRIDPSIEGYVGMTFPGSESSNTQPVQIYSTNGSGISLYTGDNNWAFNANGTTIFPTLSVDLHNGGVQSGQVLQFGDGNQQAIITGPAPIVEGYNAQRLIIQGQNGNTGEGGDVYVWGGDSQFNGGDIKIYAGDADNGASGVGGNIHISGGAGQNTGGEISLIGGVTYNGQGAPVVVTGGRGSTTGGALSLNGGYGDIDGGTITLTAGYGTTTGGAVNIIGGISGAGLPSYGNVGISAGASSWSFDNTGELTLSTGGHIGSTKGGTMLDGGPGNSTSLTSFYANGFYAGCFTAYPDGNVGITTYTGNGTAGTWSFDNTGNLTASGNLTLGGGQIQSGVPTVVSDGINAIYQGTTTTMDVYGFPFTTITRGQLTISGATSPVEVNGTWYYQSVNTNTFAIYTDSTYTTPVNSTTWAAYGGGATVLIQENLPASNIVIDANGFLSTFTNAGQLDLPGSLTAVGDIGTDGNVYAANFIGNTFSLAQTILPTIQSITITKTSSEYETSGGSGYANVLVANVAPVIEYGVIVTAGSTVDKYVAGNLANIPGTEKITISTGTSDQPFTVYAYVTTNAGTYYSGPEVGFSGLCLLKGTMISLADGTYKPIEDINNDDLLLTWDFDLGRYAQARPLWIKRGETGTRYNQLTFSDGTVLRTFDQHRIFNKQAGAFTYPMSDDTPIGTVTVNEHGQEITLIKRELIWDTIEHYNIITNHHINLFADSILTSCRFNNIYPITDMKFVKSVVLNRNLSEFDEIESRFVFGLRLQEQSFELEMIKGYVNRLLATEVTESISI